MMSDTTVIPLRQPDTIEDPLTAVLRSGARRLLAQVAHRGFYVPHMQEPVLGHEQ